MSAYPPSPRPLKSRYGVLFSASLLIMSAQAAEVTLDHAQRISEECISNSSV